MKLAFTKCFAVLSFSCLFASSFAFADANPALFGSVGDSASSGVEFVYEPGDTKYQANSHNLSIAEDGSLLVDAQTQERLNSVALHFANDVSVSGTQVFSLIAVLSQQKGSHFAAEGLSQRFLADGAEPEKVVSLVQNLQGLVENSEQLGITQPIYVASVGPIVLTELAALGSFHVDVNQLSDAIAAYNKIIVDSDSRTLKRMAKDPEFILIGDTLRKLRAAVDM